VDIHLAILSAKLTRHDVLVSGAFTESGSLTGVLVVLAAGDPSSEVSDSLVEGSTSGI